MAFAAPPVSIDVILDPCTTIVAFRSVLPVPSSTVAAWIRMVWFCASSAGAARQHGKQSGVQFHGAHYNPRHSLHAETDARRAARRRCRRRPPRAVASVARRPASARPCGPRTGLAVLRRRSGRDEVLAADRRQRVDRVAARRRLGMVAAREGARASSARGPATFRRRR